MKKNKNNIIKRLITGLKQGWNAPVLPPKVANLHNNVFTRIFRVIGGISLLTVFSKTHLLLFLPFKFIVLFIAMMHIMYITTISLIRL